jgi:hypothetical protein
MQNRNGGRALVGAATLALLAGCSGTSSVAPTASQMSQSHSGSTLGFVRKLNTGVAKLTPSGIIPHPTPLVGIPEGIDACPKSGEVGVALTFTNAVAFYPTTGQNSKSCGSITSGLEDPMSVVFDTKGNLYVGQYEASEVLVYKDGKGTPKTLSTGSGSVYGLAVDAKGDVYAGQWPNPSIAYFKGGKGSPKTLTDSNLSNLYFIALGPKGEIFVDGDSSSTGEDTVDESTDGGKTWKDIITVSSGSGFPGGLGVDPKGDLWVVDQYGYLYEYKAPYKKAPVQTIDLGQDDAPLSISKTGTELWLGIANGSYAGGIGYTDKGKQNASTAQTSSDDALGIGVSPQ